MLFLSFLLYLVLLVVTARLLATRMTGLLDFFLAQRRLPWTAVALAFVAAWFGAGSTMGSMNDAFAKGLSAIWLIGVPSVLSCLVVGLVFAKRIRRLNCLSQPEAVEKQYGPVGSFMLACIILASVTTFIASQLVAAGHLLEVSMQLTPLQSVLWILGAVVVYSVIGGYRAVVMTDILQFISFTVGILILLGFVLWATPVYPHPPAFQSAGFLNPWHDLGNRLAMVFTFVLAWSIAPEGWQRMSSTKTPADAQKAALTACAVLACLLATVVFTGMLATRHLPPGDPFAAKNVLIALAMQLPSPVFTTLVLLGVLSAITSTIDSSLNVGSLTVTRDIIHRHFWPQATPGQLVRASQVATALIGLPAAVIALYYQNLIQVLWISADIYASTMFIPVLGLFFAPASGRWAGILAMAFGAVPVTLTFLHDFHLISLPAWWPVWPYTSILGVGLSALGFGVGWAVQVLATSPQTEPFSAEGA